MVASDASSARAADAGAKTLIDYFLPTPIVCPLTSNAWGAAGVLPRDVCNGLEDSTNSQWQYWDGKILQAADGEYHMYAGRWPQNKGFADWPNSVIVEAVSSGSLMGSYVPAASTPFAGKEQNVTGTQLADGSFLLLDSPGNVYSATALDGAWTSLGIIQITANGSAVSTATTENQTLWQNADGSYLVIGRTFQEMVSGKSVLGPYVIQATIPNLQSQGYEDPVVWCSGGQYHLVANMFNARMANHFTSNDGVTNWVNRGLAYDPTSDFVRYTDGTVNHWFKIERPGVVFAGGHVTAFTFAVIDVDKTLDLANDSHGTKIIVVPFDGVSFDRDNPGPGSPGCPADSGGVPDAGAAADAGRPADGGSVDAGKVADASVPADGGKPDGTAPVDSGAIADASSVRDDGGSDEGGSNGGGVAPRGAGCSCRTAASASPGAWGTELLVGVAIALARRRRESRRTPKRLAATGHAICR